MRELISRMRWNSEIFTLLDDMFIQVGGETVLVRCWRDYRWSLVVRGGRFGIREHGPENVISYERLSLWQSWRVYRLARAFKVNHSFERSMFDDVQAELLAVSAYTKQRHTPAHDRHNATGDAR